MYSVMVTQGMHLGDEGNDRRKQGRGSLDHYMPSLYG